MSEKMKNLAVRTLSGIVLAAIMLGAVCWSQWSFGALLLVILLCGMHEFYTLAAARGVQPQRLIGMLAGVILFAANFAVVSESVFDLFSANLIPMLGFGLLLLFLVFIRELFREGTDPMANIGATLTGVAYVALPVSLMCYIPMQGEEPWSPAIMLLFIFIIWANDVFAYLVGMAFGRHRLCERLSPKKSWEGFFGGLAGAVVMGLVGARVLDGSYAAWMGLALVAAVTGVLGDLTESMFKRSAGVKDSGRLIPGHGGVLDRFDAMLVAAPFVLVYMLFVM